MRVIALIRKELALLMRDWHALLLLFVMPAIFILVMSLVLQNAYALHQGASVRYYLVDEDHGPASTALVEKPSPRPEFTRSTAHDAPAPAARGAGEERSTPSSWCVSPRVSAMAMSGATPVGGG